MKKLLTAICFLSILSSSAQQATTDDVNLVQAMFGKDKRDLMQEYMQFKDTAKANAFWRTYDRYEVERKALGKDFVAILQDYAKHYSTLNDAKADNLVMRSSANNMAFENLYKKYYGKMKPLIGSLKASQWLQLEGYLRGAVKTHILGQIPFIGQIDRSQVK